MSRNCYSSLTPLVLCCIVGCSRGPSFKTVPVSGKITYNGKPVAKATVGFMPASDAGKAGTGITDDNGQYKLATYFTPAKPLDGVPPGKYKVTVTKRTGDSAAARSTNMQGKTSADMSSQDMLKMSPQGTMTAPSAGGQAPAGMETPKSELPERYAEPGKTDLEADVPESGSATFDFDLKDK